MLLVEHADAKRWLHSQNTHHPLFAQSPNPTIANFSLLTYRV